MYPGLGNPDTQEPLLPEVPTTAVPVSSGSALPSITNMESKPLFQGLSPHDRRLMLKARLQIDPGFNQLDAPDQAKLSNMILNRHPDDALISSDHLLTPQMLKASYDVDYKYGTQPDSQSENGLFAKKIYARSNVTNLPPVIQGQWQQKYGQQVPTSDFSGIQPGDQLFYQNSNGGSPGSATHTGYYLGLDNSGRRVFAHASGTGDGVVISNVDTYPLQKLGYKRYDEITQAVKNAHPPPSQPGTPESALFSSLGLNPKIAPGLPQPVQGKVPIDVSKIAYSSSRPASKAQSYSGMSPQDLDRGAYSYAEPDNTTKSSLPEPEPLPVAFEPGSRAIPGTRTAANIYKSQEVLDQDPQYLAQQFASAAQAKDMPAIAKLAPKMIAAQQKESDDYTLLGSRALGRVGQFLGTDLRTGVEGLEASTDRSPITGGSLATSGYANASPTDDVPTKQWRALLRGLPNDKRQALVAAAQQALPGAWDSPFRAAQDLSDAQKGGPLWQLKYGALSLGSEMLHDPTQLAMMMYGPAANLAKTSKTAGSAIASSADIQTMAKTQAVSESLKLAGHMVANAGITYQTLKASSDMLDPLNANSMPWAALPGLALGGLSVWGLYRNYQEIPKNLSNLKGAFPSQAVVKIMGDIDPAITRAMVDLHPDTQPDQYKPTATELFKEVNNLKRDFNISPQEKAEKILDIQGRFNSYKIANPLKVVDPNAPTAEVPLAPPGATDIINGTKTAPEVTADSAPVNRPTPAKQEIFKPLERTWQTPDIYVSNTPNKVAISNLSAAISNLTKISETARANPDTSPDTLQSLEQIGQSTRDKYGSAINGLKLTPDDRKSVYREIQKSIQDSQFIIDNQPSNPIEPTKGNPNETSTQGIQQAVTSPAKIPEQGVPAGGGNGGEVQTTPTQGVKTIGTNEGRQVLTPPDVSITEPVQSPPAPTVTKPSSGPVPGLKELRDAVAIKPNKRTAEQQEQSESVVFSPSQIIPKENYETDKIRTGKVEGENWWTNTHFAVKGELPHNLTSGGDVNISKVMPRIGDTSPARIIGSIAHHDNHKGSTSGIEGKIRYLDVLKDADGQLTTLDSTYTRLVEKTVGDNVNFNTHNTGIQPTIVTKDGKTVGIIMPRQLPENGPIRDAANHLSAIDKSKSEELSPSNLTAGNGTNHPASSLHDELTDVPLTDSAKRKIARDNADTEQRIENHKANSIGISDSGDFAIPGHFTPNGAPLYKHPASNLLMSKEQKWRMALDYYRLTTGAPNGFNIDQVYDDLKALHPGIQDIDIANARSIQQELTQEHLLALVKEEQDKYPEKKPSADTAVNTKSTQEVERKKTNVPNESRPELDASKREAPELLRGNSIDKHENVETEAVPPTSKGGKSNEVDTHSSEPGDGLHVESSETRVPVRRSDGTPEQGHFGSADGTRPSPLVHELAPTPETVSSSPRAAEVKAEQSPKIDTPTLQNFKLTVGEALANITNVSKSTSLIKALQVLHKLRNTGKLATPEEQAILARFPGWGWTGNLLNDKNAKSGAQRYYEYTDIVHLLTPEQLASAKTATMTSHYTHPEVIARIYQAIGRLGFSGGTVLEPSAGSGLFLGLMPDEMQKTSRFVGVEKDMLTAEVLKHLYQASRIEAKPYEKVQLPDNFFDMAISNVPFGALRITDPNMVKRVGSDDLNKRIHNYFIANMIANARPGGLVVAITSDGTMDAKDTIGNKSRAYIASQADLIGAIRLPNNAFQANAGTSVTTDILFFRKKSGDANDLTSPPKWQSTVEVPADNGENIAKVNEYYIANPDMVLGDHSMKGSMYSGKDDYTLKARPGQSLDEAIDKAISNLPENVYTTGDPGMDMEKALQSAKQQTASVKGRDNSLHVNNDGNIVLGRDALTGRQMTLEAKEAQAIKAYVPLRDQLLAMLTSQRTGVATDETIKGDQQKLKAIYDRYVKSHGALHGNSSKAWEEDPQSSAVKGIEIYNPKDKTVTGLADVFTKRVQRPIEIATHVGTTDAALIVSLNEKGHIDLDLMSKLTNQSKSVIATDLISNGLAYNDPQSGYVTNSEYGSGNVKLKLDQAIAAASKDSQFNPNVEFLKSIQPKPLTPGDIIAKLGANWMPPELYSQFYQHITGTKGAVQARQNSINGEWWFTAPRNDYNSAMVKSQYGTEEMSAIQLLHAMMNSKPIKVMITVGDRRVIDEAATALAKAKAEAILEEWHKWISSDPDRTSKMVDTYNNDVNVWVKPKFDGSHLNFPGMNDSGLTLRPHQYDAVQRIVTSNNTLLAHDAGMGKSAILHSAAMTLRRINPNAKIVMGLLKSTIAQQATAFNKLYPGAKILTPSGPEDFSPAGRDEFISRMATGDWDAILISHDQLKQIPVNPQTLYDHIQEQYLNVTNYLTQNGRDRSNVTVKRLEAQQSNLMVKLQKLHEDITNQQSNNSMYWDDLGITHVFIDESQKYKNATVISTHEGLGKEGSQLADDLMVKIHQVQQNGGGIVFSTGTPLTNSIAEVHSIMQYLAPDLLKQSDIASFDSWINNYATVESAIEQNVAGKYVEKQRFSSFSNVPELMTMYLQFADVKQLEDVPEIKVPELVDTGGKKTGEYIEVHSQISPEQREFFKEMVDRAGNVGPAPGQENMLNIATDGRHVTLDPRTRIPNAPDHPYSKVNLLAKAIAKEYFNPQSMADNRTQLVFLDLSTPKPGFNLYDDIKTKLVQAGIPAAQIAYRQTAKTSAATQALFADVNEGKIRILIGSREGMGIGVNVNKHLIAVHQVDPTWRPDQIIQSNARILRQESAFLEQGVKIYMHITPGSFDSFMFAKIKSKSKFIDQFSPKNDARSVEDLEGGNSFTMAQLAAVASGDPRIEQLIKLHNDSKKLLALQRGELNAAKDANYQIHKRTQLIEVNKSRIYRLEQIESAIANASKKANPNDLEPFVDAKGNSISDRKTAGKILADFAENLPDENVPEPWATYSGCKLAVFRTTKMFMGDSRVQFYVDITPPNILHDSAQIWSSRIEANMQSETGTIQSIRNAIDGMPEQAKYLKEASGDASAEIPILEEQAGREFSKQAELDKVTEKLKEIEDSLKADKTDTEEQGWGAGALSMGMPGFLPPHMVKLLFKTIFQKLKAPARSMRDTFVGNLFHLEHLSPEAAVVARSAGPNASRAQANVINNMAMSAIDRASNGKTEAVMELLQDGRLRGLRERWGRMATGLKMSDIIEGYKYHGEDKYKPTDNFNAALSALDAKPQFKGIKERYENQIKALNLLDNPRLAMASITSQFKVDADRARLLVSNQMSMTDTEFAKQSAEPDMKAGVQAYKEHLENEMETTHGQNSGIFTDTKGPLNAYFPLNPINEDGKTEIPYEPGTKAEYGVQANRRNRFATGLSKQYDSSPKAVAAAYKATVVTNNKARLIQQLVDDNILQPIKDVNGVETVNDKPIRQITQNGYSSDAIMINGIPVPATRVPMTTDTRIIIPNSKILFASAKEGLVPTSIYRELLPVVTKWGKNPSPNSAVQVLHALNTFSLQNPREGIGHARNLIGTIIAKTPYIGPSLMDKMVSSNIFTKLPAVIYKASTTDITIPKNQADLREMARLGMFSERTMSTTRSQRIADLTHARLTGPLSMHNFIYGPHGMDVKFKLLMFQVAKLMNGIDGQIDSPEKAMEIARYVDGMGQYNRELSSTFVRLLKDSAIGPFATANTTMFKNGIDVWAKAFSPDSLPTKGLPTSKRVSLKIAQMLSVGAVAFIATWAAIHKMRTGKNPLTDPQARFGEILLTPIERKSAWAQTLFGPGDTPAYLSLGFFNPIALRGAQSTGIRGAFNTKVEGGTNGQAIEKAFTDSLNSMAQPVTGGPVAHSAFVGLTGHEPYLQNLNNFQLKDAVGPTKPGLPRLGAQAREAVLSLNSFYGDLAALLGIGHKADALRRMTPGERATRTVVNMAFPGLVGFTHDDTRETELLQKDDRLRNREELPITDNTYRSLKDTGIPIPKLGKGDNESDNMYTRRQSGFATSIDKMVDGMEKNNDFMKRPIDVRRGIMENVVRGLERSFAPPKTPPAWMLHAK